MAQKTIIDVETSLRQCSSGDKEIQSAYVESQNKMLQQSDTQISMRNQNYVTLP